MDVHEIKDAIGSLASTVSTRLESLEQDLKAQRDENAALLDRVEEAESKSSTPLRTGDRSGVSRADREHTDVFTKWLRDARNPQKTRLLLECESDLEHKDVTTTSQAGGGYGVPLEVVTDIERKIPMLNPLRSLVRTVTVSQPNTRFLVDIRGETNGWAGETDSRSSTTTPSLRERIPTFGTNYALPRVTEEGMNDIAFDVRSWLTDDSADGFASAEALAILSGNGTSRPTGIFNTTPTTVADEGSPLRAAGVIEYVASAASPDAILPDALIDLVHRVKSQYLDSPDGVAFVTSRASLGSIRKLKDGQSQYLWAQGLNGSSGNGTLLGFPVVTCDHMAAVGANAFPVLFGNFRRGYLLALILGMRITVDDNISTPGYVRFYIRRRLGGCVLNNDAIKALRTT